MKTGIVYFSNSQNLGDDIQSYAASKLISDPVFIERESLNTISDSLDALISGWFMNNPENFPPSENINPLFISFHGKSSVVSEKHFNYFKKHEPIGCRDFHTMRLFENIGIKAYFSGCATLTLSPPIKNYKKGNEILIVDLLRANYTADYRNSIKKNLIPDEWKNKVSYFSHSMNDLPLKSIEERMNLVEDVLMRYAKAKLVITSLIHCALPCIAMGTPVLFIDFGFDKNPDKRDRFEGITDLMNIYSDVKAPLSKRNYLSAALRILRFHRFLQHKIKPIPLDYFEKPKSNPPMDVRLVNQLKKRISEFEKGSDFR